MPDWFYRTLTQPVLFRLPAVQARGLALGFLGRLARLPGGSAVIDFLGHMRADPRLRQSFLGCDVPTGVGLGPGLDARCEALPALARFGFGFLDVGPVSVAGSSGPPIERRPGEEAIWSPEQEDALPLAVAAPRLKEAARSGLPLIVRLAPASSAGEGAEVVRTLAPFVHFFALAATADAATWRSVLDAAREASVPRPVLLLLPAGGDPATAEAAVDAALAAGASGLLIDGAVRADGTAGGRLIGSPAREPALRQVRHWRARLGPDLPLIASGGVHEPADALALRAAGADLVEIDSGLVYSGPGLPKRINDALLYEVTRAAVPEAPVRAPERTWFWTALLGTGMLLGSLIALGIAMTRVVLPYDEVFVGLHRHEIEAINPRLLHFMAHDRVSLAGTMIAIGVMYLGLSLYGIRHGVHWARQALFASAFTGFASFFLFLGFGYLDTFHAFVTAVLFQLLLLGVHGRLGTWVPDTAPPLRGDRAWRRSLWGQLLLVLHGTGLLAAGGTISVVGITSVFVPQDLEFMATTAGALAAANPHLVPLIAHDRATFGGMILAAGLTFLCSALWGFRQGSSWLWWSFGLAGSSAYAAALAVHLSVGYTNVLHLLPVFLGWGVLLLGLALCRTFLCSRPAP